MRANFDAQPHCAEFTVQRLAADCTQPDTFIQNYLKPGVPVVITGLLGQDAAWTVDFLRQHLGDRTFPVRHYGRDRYQQDKRTWDTVGSGVNVRTLTFNDYAALLENGEAHDQDLYLARSALTHTPLAQAPALVQAEQRLGFTSPVTALNLWVGPSGHISCLHYDPMDGTLMQLQGSKHIILFPPDQLYNLYPFAVMNHLWYGLRRRAVYSQVYPDRPDFDSFPRFQEALRHRQDVTLKPGEILFIPSGWWHEVSSVGAGAVLSINRWWNVPWGRSLRTWSKWRAHLGSVMAVPHTLREVLPGLVSATREYTLKELLQRL
ncbi:MAG: cupin-like domain-containing protein [Kaiparowitsia implicata GSE-PSE-MK54-09C]|nr:cupin-like domain-containing protein [Kaiparowitsia implicata GSE-PSE-MK54-09C]